MVPFDEIVAEAKGVGKQSKSVVKEYLDLVAAFGSEFNIMVNASQEKLFSKMPEKIAQGVKNVREKNLNILPGYDGEYGTIKIFGEKEQKNDEQLTLF